LDLTLTVMLPPRGARDFTQSAHPKWRPLSVVAVHACRYRDEEVTAQNTGVLHVLHSPFKNVVEATEALAQPVEDELLIGNEVMKVTREKREYVADPLSLSEKCCAQLLDARQATVEWDEFAQAWFHVDRPQETLAESARVVAAKV